MVPYSVGGDEQTQQGLRTPMLYPPIEPYRHGFLEVDGGHRIYWELCGNPSGRPALFLHGGPGGGCTATNRRLFDPRRYCLVLFDQRGCGRSQPSACIAANTTAHLLADIERLRCLLGIDNWLLFGGSWGATLALAYAQAHPERASALVLRSVFTARRAELRWLYQEGATRLFPEAWARFLAPIAMAERQDLVAAYHARLNCGDPAIEATTARAWCAWEDEIMTLLPEPPSLARDDPALLTLARVEAHYMVHRGFLREGQLLADAARLQGIPGVIVQGRYDAVTPPSTAWELQQAWPQAELRLVPDAGHASSEPGNLRELIAATDRFARC
ncbi:MAG TPA: prolyl aminopeptidase [Rhodocyclaceae bacterium]|nr:prolyl aminopeptidase [Rhodocyclaceae bacterium]